MGNAACPICSTRVENFINHGPSYGISCPRCGVFTIGDIAAMEIQSWHSKQKINLSGWIQENPGCEIYSRNLKELSNLRDLTLGEKGEKVLLSLAQRFSRPGERLDLSGGAHLRFLAVARLIDNDELHFLMREYLHEEMGFLLMHELDTGLGADRTYKISPKGWAYLDSLRRGNPDSQIGFIAMWFDKTVESTHSVIEIGIRNSGYDALRIDGKEHNNKIDDEIVAGIRRSKFLVADFTGHRGGVYFEAGLATGLGLPVIWLCRKDELEKTHFDTRQYNFIVWEADKLDELSKALKNRIEATIGRGPLQAAT